MQKRNFKREGKIIPPHPKICNLGHFPSMRFSIENEKIGQNIRNWRFKRKYEKKEIEFGGILEDLRR